ncbi:MAG: chemotaxis response regulator protein-glutamate methylesterase [Verrucomicrobia bacterium]|nr:chemotaxis response regulator protein-glutamate methylesterase [Verrucomicrobiota bacterium]
MPKIRVLIVDDSVVIRRLLTDALSQDPDIQVVGSASNGRIALDRITQVNPDVITLDVEMPVLDGIETLRALRPKYPKLPVIMFSTLTEKGASATVKALMLGANDYVAKPANVGSVREGTERIRLELVPKIKALCRRSAPWLAQPAAGSRDRRPATGGRDVSVTNQPIEIVVIGVSTGGPNALARVIPEIPPGFPVPILIVQHMPKGFTQQLAERLTTISRIRVSEGRAGDALSPGQAWIAPGDFHMTVRRPGLKTFLHLNQDPPENSCRPAVDVMFRSVAQSYGGRALAVILTGMGVDGLRGCELIHERGGRVLVQDRATSVVWGMPGAVSMAGLAEPPLALDKISAEIKRLVSVQGRSAPVSGTPASSFSNKSSSFS